ncbi:DUF943 family protein [Erwinia mallotivora]|uniref:DUF943 family protein n=1 Tax=Erwinia mallotivora TaxID=69222 RepID=UPI0021C1A8D9|nr:DUF943 family protein [Erwinia mallotivora]
MKIEKKFVRYILSLTGAFFAVFFLWLSLRPVEIVAIHHRSSGFSDVLVKNFPCTDKGKINWWLKNKNTIGKKYQIPTPDRNGNFSLTFWLFGEGYKQTDGYDMLCFNDMKTPVNCIEKNAIFSVEKSPNLGTVYTVYNGGDYQLDNNGKIVEIHRK